uniref:Rne/Rng family ribonuclease n=1 Tax=Gephyromycinifex aptenodytis TaxID=2716227 RepID=UPI0029CA25B4|nr:Rne/Rng family ribonuclease [Gephyromycinifex aptenodytis]
MASPKDTFDETKEPISADTPAEQGVGDSITSDAPEVTAPPAPRKRAARKRVTAAVTTPEPAAAESAVAEPATAQPADDLAAAQPAAADVEAAPAPAPRKRATRKRATAKATAPQSATAPEPAETSTDAVAEAPDAAADQAQPVFAATPPAAAAPGRSTPVLDPADDPVVMAARSAKQRAGEPAPAAEEESAAEPAAAVPTFGLLFKAPEPAVVPRRTRARRPEPEPEAPQSDLFESPAEDEPDQATEPAEAETSRGGGSRRGRARTHASDENAQEPQETSDSADADESGEADGDDSNDDDQNDSNGRRRRRRGGRGRRRSEDSEERRDQDDSGSTSGSGADTDSGADADSDAGSDSSDDDSDQGHDDNGDSGSGRKRTRRRRRSTNAVEGEDPPGTVTRVREPRARREEATGIKGSTRLEAKKQRRREGREAGRRRTIITEAEFLARRESVERVMVVRELGERTQIGVLEDDVLVEHYISGTGTGHGTHGASMAGNVYLGRVQNVLPSMEAAFVDIGKGRNAVLYAGEVNWDAAGLEQHKTRRIENALSPGQSVLVQVTKDPIGHKGARLTSQISLPGRYLVYVPQGSMTGISRKLPDTERARLKKILKQIVPDDAGVIVRTAAEGASEAELTADVQRLRKAWENIEKRAKSGNAPVLLRGEADLTTRVVRDVFNEDFSKLVVSGQGAWETVSEYVESVAPDLLTRLEKWTGEQDVFAVHRVDEQLSKAMDRKVWLPSGGSLVIDRTEAMTVIDVNTGKFTGAGGNLEETVTKNNIEAAEEIVRQLRLRDIGGIIVVDFIDMVLEANRDLVVRRLLECLGRDRTKHQVAEVTSLGLVQMTRKRVGAGLIEVYSDPCEHCGGSGIIVSSDPIDRSDGSSSGSDSSGGGRSRRGRGNSGGGNSGGGNSGGGNSGNDRSSKRSGRDAGESSDKSEPAGLTPAQVAAAAYAAAVQSHAQEATRNEEPTVSKDELDTIVSERLGDAASGQTSPSEQSPAPSGRTGRVRRRAGSAVTSPGEDAGTLDSSSAPAQTTPATPSPQTTPVTPAKDSSEEAGSGSQPQTPVEAPAAAPKRRRRAVSTSVVTTADSEAAVFTADTAPVAPKAPLTVLASQVAPAESVTSGTAEPSAKPRRTARRAAGAPAGPPNPTS